MPRPGTSQRSAKAQAARPAPVRSRTAPGRRATVKTHVSRLLTKLAARDRAQLIVVAYESGFVTPA
jgi:hypothetical protein